jgi:hypothetical protein
LSILTAEQFARLLDGREYTEEITKEVEAIAAESRLFVFFGYSDDNLELRGIIYDEIGVYEGDEITLALFERQNCWKQISEDNKEFAEMIVHLKSFNVKIDWCPEGLDCSWLITTDVPSFPFDIMEDGNLFCRGIVIAESDVLEHLNSKGSAQ